MQKHLICHMLLALFFTVLRTNLAAQPILNGRVTDAQSGEPIPYATVYIDGTTIGDITSEGGEFSLPIGRVSLPATLIISHLSYQDTSLYVSQPRSAWPIRLYASDNELSTIEVLDKNQREQNLQEFSRVFLGSDAWGKSASISQTEQLLFNRQFERKTVRNLRLFQSGDPLPSHLLNPEWAVDSQSLSFDQATSLEVSSRQPLKVDLPDLGYRILVGLQQFDLEYATQSYMLLGTFFFQPYEGLGQKAKKKHEKNRLLAYYNSSQHFLRALYQDQLEEQGYRIFEKVGKDSFAPFDLQPYISESETGEQILEGLQGRELVIAYYADARGKPLPPSKQQGKQPIQSGLVIMANQISLRKDGTVGNTSLYFSGEMGRRAVAWLLPSDYQPD